MTRVRSGFSTARVLILSLMARLYTTDCHSALPSKSKRRAYSRCVVTGPPNGPALLCSLASVVCSHRLSSSVTLPAGGRAGCRARGQSGDRHCTAGQYGYVPLGRHLVSLVTDAVYGAVLWHCMFSQLGIRLWPMHSVSPTTSGDYHCTCRRGASCSSQGARSQCLAQPSL